MSDSTLSTVRTAHVEAIMHTLIDALEEYCRDHPDTSAAEIFTAQLTLMHQTIESIRLQSSAADYRYNMQEIRRGLSQILLHTDDGLPVM